ncbi:uncharacterized protein si:dkey-192k22.2 isoform X3 [Onychostoma macrolepis]|uniref:uncharacterized protein si:dkey-192k22.2 isoform X3 n=1 Tax=Onychostoma macrolepis TaxID=369639 RepID=UPI00272976FA|nr:uncharacterized protein si:dkey-192k22.2 isoform X3 [Onychostoma macrolepis]
MTRSGAVKLSILFFLTFILCLPEFFPNISQIEFLCEPFDPCTPKNDAQVCAPSGPPCATEMINASGQHTSSEGWYLCKTEMDLQRLHNNTLQSEEHVMVLLTMKAGNLSGWNITSTDELKCQPTSSSFLFYYQENNETARSAALPVTQTRKDGRWCMITSVWLALVLTVIVVTLLSVGNLIFKSRKRKSRLVASVPVSVCGHQLKERSKEKENLMSAVPDVSIAMCSISDGDVFSEKSSMGNRTEENLLKVADLTYKRSLSPIYEMTETSLDELKQNEDEEDEQCNASVTKEELKKTHQLQHLAAQGHCEPPTYLHHRSNFSCSGYEEDGEL